jgi:hypothetical protein
MRENTEADLDMWLEFLDMIGNPDMQAFYLAQLTAEARRPVSRDPNKPSAEDFLRRRGSKSSDEHAEMSEWEYRQKVKSGEIFGPPVRRLTAVDIAMMQKQEKLVRTYGAKEGARRWEIMRPEENARLEVFLKKLAEEGS